MRVRDLMDERPEVVTVLGTRPQVVQALRRAPVPAVAVLKHASRKLMGVATAPPMIERLHEDRIILLMDPNAPFTYPEAPLDEAADLFLRYQARLLPVLNASNDLLGVLRPAHVLGALRPRRERVAGEITRRVVPVHHGTPLRVALEILRVTRAPAMPVLDDQARLAGLLDARAVLEEAIADDAPQRLARPVTALMDPRPPTFDAGDELAAAAELFLRQTHAHAVLVDQERRVLDLVRDVDILNRTAPGRAHPTGLM